MMKSRVDNGGRAVLRGAASIASLLLLAACGDDATTPKTWTAETVHEAIKESNPNYDGKGEFRIEFGQVQAAQLGGTGVTDLSPLAGMALQGLDLRGLPITDIAALAGLPLVELYLEETQVEDITPLSGMPLVKLYLSSTPVSDLSALKGMPLRELNLLGAAVTDLTPLRRLPLEMLWLNDTPVADISPLSRCPLISLTLHRTRVKDLSPLARCGSLQRLHIGETRVSDLTPITTLALTRLVFSPERIEKGIAQVRQMRSLQELGATFENRMPPQQFWGLFDQGKFR